MNVLRALERAALNIKPGEIDEISCRGTWKAGQNG